MNVIAERSRRITEQAIAAGAIQKPGELSRLIEWALRALPEDPLIVEIGCDAGGTLAAWTMITPNVVGISLQGGPFSTTRPLHTHGASVWELDSRSPIAHRALSLELNYHKRAVIDFLFIDGDHTYDGVAYDWNTYGPLARWVAFHDIISDPLQPNMGVARLWEEIKAASPADCLEFIVPPLTSCGIGVCRGGVL